MHAKALVAACLFISILPSGFAIAQPCTLVPASAANSSTEAAPQRLALLVGVGNYKSPKISQLVGPPNDVARMKSLLVEKFEFPDANIRTLVDAEATRQAILNEFCNHLVARARANDVVLFYFSGHGSRVADRDPIDESDGYDETLVPHDARQSGIEDIRDDEIQALLDRLATRNVTLIFDSCHSGTGARAFARPRGIDPEPSEVEAANKLLAQRPTARSVIPNNGFQPTDSRYVLIAGSRADQLSYEFPFQEGTHGVLTYYLTQVLRSAGPEATYRDVVERAAAYVTSKFQYQTPQLEGVNQDNLIFQGISALASPYVQAAPAPGGLVQLAAGSVHGVTEGSTYAVHAPGTREFTGTPVATIEITGVQAFQSLAKITSGGSIAPASRAVELTHADPGRRVKVFAERDQDGVLSDTLINGLRQAVATARRDVEFVNSPEGADLLVARPPLSSPPAERRREIAIHFPDAAQASAAIGHDNPNKVNELAFQLSQWAHWFGVLGLENPQHKLSASVKTELVGSVDNTPADKGLGLVVKNGGKFSVRIKNTHTRPLFAHVLGLFPNGRIVALWPPRGSSEQVAVGSEWTDVYDADTQGYDRVLDYLKIILSTQPVDVVSLERPGMKAKAAMNSLERLLTDAVEGTRNLRRSESGDWLTFVKPVTVIK
jgi:hypothetical protein